MRALVLENTRDEEDLSHVTFKQVEQPRPANDKCLIRIKAASLNHRDLWIRKGLYPGIRFGSVLGSDGAGVVIAEPHEAGSLRAGAEVIINASIGWLDDPLGPPDSGRSYGILGLLPQPGTFAEYISIPKEYVHLKPKYLTFEEAASIPVAGLTAYRAVFSKGKITSGMKVLVTGIGGGVALFALQFCVAIGAKVFVTSSSKEKIDAAIKLGATDGVIYTEGSWSKNFLSRHGLMDAIIDGAGGSNLNHYIRIVKIGGVVVSYGTTAGVTENFNVAPYFLKQVEIRGSTMGNNKEFAEMLRFLEKHHIKPVISKVLPFEHIHDGFHLMKSSKQFGKIVVALGDQARL